MEQARGRHEKVKEIQGKFWKTTFSLATTWRQEENAESVSKFCAGIRSL